MPNLGERRDTMGRSFVGIVSRQHVAAAFVVVLVAAACAAQSSPARTTSVAAGSAASTKVVSKKYGYTFVVAGHWFVHYAVTQWLGGFPFGHSPDVDFIGDPHDRKFIVAAKRLPVGTTLDEWTAIQVATMESEVDAGKPLCTKARAFRDTTIGGEPAHEFQHTCGGPYDVIVLTTVHRGRGYIFQFVSPKPNTAASDRRTYDAERRSFRFTPK